MRRETTPSFVAKPATEGDLRQVVCWAAERGYKMRVKGGSSAADSPLTRHTEGILIDLAGMAGVVDIATESSGEAPVVTVQAGMTVGALDRYLYPRGLRLEVSLLEKRATIAGAIATGSYGTSHQGVIASGSMLCGASVMRADGRVIECGGKEIELEACRLHLGVVGIFVRLQLQLIWCPVEPARPIRGSLRVELKWLFEELGVLINEQISKEEIRQAEVRKQTNNKERA